MPVNTPHPEYEDNIAIWSKIRDVVSGEEAVKKGGVKYAPMLTGLSRSEYDAYITRAEFFNATDRTIKGLTGAIMRRPPTVDLPSTVEEFRESLGFKGESFDLMTKKAVDEVMTTGRYGLYVDASDDPESRPYVLLYFPENIINWKTETIGGREQLTMVVLKESFDEEGVDEFTFKEKDQWRVLRLEGSTTVSEDGVSVDTDFTYHVEVWRENNVDKTQEDFIKISDTIPTRNGGRPLDYIPFYLDSQEGFSAEVLKSPILDLVNVNLSHYRTSADLEHGRHFTALPTPVVTGVSHQTAEEETQDFTIGGTSAWVLQDADSKAFYLEFSGQGLESLERAQEKKESRMGVIGARLLEPQRPGIETAEAIKLRQSGEGSVLLNISSSVSEAMQTVMGWVSDWMGVQDSQITVQLNTDFNVSKVDPRMLTALMMALQAGKISFDTWFYNLQKGEITPPDIDTEDERQRIGAGMPGEPVPLILDDAEDEDDEAQEGEAA